MARAEVEGKKKNLVGPPIEEAYTVVIFCRADSDPILHAERGMRCFRGGHELVVGSRVRAITPRVFMCTEHWETLPSVRELREYLGNLSRNLSTPEYQIVLKGVRPVTT